MERLDKFLCDSGAGTRSQVKLILRAGRVQVDGAPEKDGGRKIDPAKNEITLDGVRLAGKYRAVFMMNKPEAQRLILNFLDFGCFEPDKIGKK